MFGNIIYLPMNSSDLKLMMYTVDARIRDLNSVENHQRLTEKQTNERFELLNLKKKFALLMNTEQD